MGLKCKVSYENGRLSVKDEQGRIPSVYTSALEAFKNEDQALRAWATTYTEDFQQETRRTPQSATFDDVVRYYDSAGANLNRLDVDERYSVVEFMKRNGFSSLSDLNKKLTSVFKPNGVLEINPEAAESLYSVEELEDLDPVSLINILAKVEGQLQVEDIFVEPETSKFTYKDTSRKTIFGTYQKVSETEIDRAILDLITDTSQIQDVVKQLPFDNFVDSFYSNDSFARRVISRFENLKRIPVLRFVGEELTDQDVSVYTTVKNTLLANVNNLSIEAEVGYLEEIDPQLWDISTTEIQQILKEVEKSLIDVNIDVVGMSAHYQERERILTLLNTVTRLLRNPSEENLRNYSDNYVSLFGPTLNQRQVWENVADQYKDLNIVRVESYLDNNTLFRNHGLIKIADNTYHKVQRGQTDELYDYLYDKVVSNDIIIPQDFRTYENLENKPQVLADLTKYVMSRDIGMIADPELYEEISLNQLAFDHIPIARFTSNQEDMAALAEIQMNEDYLKSDFVSEFYNYVLEEKQKNSELFTNTLAAFQITDADISLKYPISIDNLKYTQELTDYFKLKRDTSLKYTYSPSETMVLTDLLYLNHPRLIPTYEGQVIEKTANYVVVSPTQSNFIKLNEGFYRKALSKDGADLFLFLSLSSDSVYFTANLNFDFDVEAAQNYFDGVVISVPFDFTGVTETPDIQTTQSFLDSNIELVNLYSEKERRQIEKDTQDCG